MEADMAFPAYKRIATLGRFQLVRKGFAFGHQYELTAQLHRKRFTFILSRKQFTLELRPG
jgi:hypothetical protein